MLADSLPTSSFLFALHPVYFSLFIYSDGNIYIFTTNAKRKADTTMMEIYQCAVAKKIADVDAALAAQVGSSNIVFFYKFFVIFVYPVISFFMICLASVKSFSGAFPLLRCNTLWH